jgi:hypothetical protein
LHCLCPTFLNFDRQFNMLFFKKSPTDDWTLY